MKLRRLGAHSALIFGFVAQALQYGAGLIVLPFMVTRLSASELGIWYLFLAVQGLAALVDFGFQPTLARAFASAYAGAAELRKEGHAEGSGDPNLVLVKHILTVCRRLYLALAATVLGLLLTAGTAYIYTLIADTPLSLPGTMWAWALLSGGTALSLYFSWNYALLAGADRVASSYAAQVAGRGGFVVIGIGSLLLGGGLVGLACANLLSILISRGVAGYRMRPLLVPLATIADSAPHSRRVLRTVWPNASRMGLVALGAFFINRANLLIVSAFLGLPAAAAYGITLQLLTAVNSVSLLSVQTALPQMVQLRVKGQTAALRSLFIKRQALLLGTFVVGALTITLLGYPLLDRIGSTVQLVPRPVLLLMAFVLLLEANHSACAFVITTNNKVPFVAPALLSGLGVAILATLAAASGYGLLGVILAQGLVQAAYNNWKWPALLWKDLRNEPAAAV